MKERKSDFYDTRRLDKYLVVYYDYSVARKHGGPLEIKAKFHYAILVTDRFEAGSKLVADRLEVGRRPAARWNLGYHLARC